MNQAFVLGAGLGERLRPLTEQLPKPLIPVFHRPLITHAFDHLLQAGVKRFVVNTHHLSTEYEKAFPDQHYHRAPIAFRHESPLRLETAGGIANVRDLLHEEPFLVYNGDILTDLPLAPLIQEHQRSDNVVTLALRSHGPALHIAYNDQYRCVTDIRNRLETGNEGTHLFTGIYACSPAFHDWLTPGKAESVIPIFLQMIRQSVKVGAVVLDAGHWWDLGSRTQYLAAHGALNGMHGPAIHPTAHISSDAVLRRTNIIGPGAIVEPGCHLEDCILWPQAKVVMGARLSRCIVRSHVAAAGTFEDLDF